MAILGSGNIGTDLLMKVRRSEVLEISRFIGKNKNSENLKMAVEMGIPVSAKSIRELVENPGCCQIVFDATSANAHVIHAPILRKMGVFTIDLTPSRIGKACIPAINGDQCLGEKNINLITCGGQATVPIAYELSKISGDIGYIETVSTIAAKSAGKGTRDNIDEFIETTRNALCQFTGVKNTKSIMILNSAEPPINMRNTIYVRMPDMDLECVADAIAQVEKRMQEYVPGYKVIVGPTYINGILAVTVQVTGRGDYLPEYSGNLDIITCAAVEMAERYARQMIGREGWQF